MKVGFVFTNYNNSIYTRNAVNSIYSSSKSTDSLVVIVDNRSDESDLESLKSIKSDYPEINIIYNKENVGYFSGLNVGIRYIRDSQPDIKHIVIGNNDLVFPDDFIESIQTRGESFYSHAVISPDLITLDGVHQNPHVISDISKIREFIWDVYYTNYYFTILINAIARATRKLTERKDFEEYHIPRKVAQGYGACYILGPIFFENFDSLWAPTFLMGEEFFLTKQLNGKNLHVYYDPIFKIFHHDHATMGKLPNKELWKISKQAHKVYRQYVRPFWMIGSSSDVKYPESK